MAETVVGENGMVVAPHRAAAESGAAVLRAGGNALEAMIAAAATIAVVYSHMNGIGGDVFFIVVEPGRPPRAVSACGRAGARSTIARYHERGYDTLPARGVDAMVTVPGAVSGWQQAIDIAGSLGGRLPRRDLLADAIAYAKDGSAVTRSQAAAIAEDREGLTQAPGFADHFMVDGKAPEVGATFTQPRLADTLDHLAHAGFEDFYRGDISAEIAADLQQLDAAITRADLVAHTATLEDPLSVRFDKAMLYNTPPPTQGLASLIILALFDRLGIARGESFDHIHGLIEATTRAAAVRDTEIRDPDVVGDIDRFLQAAWLDPTAAGIDMRQASAPDAGPGDGDTIWAGAIDQDGLSVSFIQSLYWAFGSGVVLPRTGIVWQNRGIGFSLDPGSHDPLVPGRRPAHTLTPPFARFDDGRALVYGSMGGDGQPQFQSAIFTRHVCFGMEPGEAIAAPRWRWGRTWGEDRPGVAVESRFDPDLVAALSRAGHDMHVLDVPYADQMGHAGMIVRRADGRLLGASDPRCDGAAVAA
ncbi:gamma-glutamyltransferase family protein [Bauldia sp.]|uniref:gamma-glutamyltransferase family protein n=1 Tax=Bauldia sp. TaxID=2575872 RepID=UPI003BAA2BEA